MSILARGKAAWLVALLIRKSKWKLEHHRIRALSRRIKQILISKSSLLLDFHVCFFLFSVEIFKLIAHLPAAKLHLTAR